MKIGIDCSLVPGERVGIGQYAYYLVQALSGELAVYEVSQLTPTRAEETFSDLPSCPQP